MPSVAASVAAVLFLYSDAFAQRRVVVWSEGTAPKDVYPDDINGAVAEGLDRLDGWQIVRANLDDLGQGLSDERLAVTVRLGNEALAAAIDGAQVRLAESGKLAELGRRWLGAATGSTAVLG